MYSGANQDENCVVFLNIVEHFVRLRQEGRKKCYAVQNVGNCNMVKTIPRTTCITTLRCFSKRCKNLFYFFLAFFRGACWTRLWDWENYLRQSDICIHDAATSNEVYTLFWFNASLFFVTEMWCGKLPVFEVQIFGFVSKFFLTISSPLNK